MTPVIPAVQAEVGPMVSAFTVESALEQTLRDWFTAYLCEAERQHGLQAGLIAWPRGWIHTGSDLQKMPQDQLPCLIIQSTGIVTPPVRSAMPVTIGSPFQRPAGNLTATFQCEVACVFNAAWDAGARRNAQLYAVALRECVLQRPLEGLPSTVMLRGESWDALDFERTRTYAAAVVGFDITVESIGWTDGGPPPAAAPPTDPTQPFDPWPEVLSTDVEVNKRPLDETPIQQEDQ